MSGEPKDPIELVDGSSRFSYKTGKTTPAEVPMTFREVLLLGVVIAGAFPMAIFLGIIFIKMMVPRK